MFERPVVNVVLVNNKNEDKFIESFESAIAQVYNPYAIVIFNYGDNGDKERLLSLPGLTYNEFVAQKNEHGFEKIQQGTYKDKAFAMFSTEKILSEDLCKSIAIEATAHQVHVYGFLSGTEKYVGDDVVEKCTRVLEKNFNMVGVVYPDRIYKGVHSVGQFHNGYFVSQLFLQNFKTLPNINNINDLYARGHVLNVPEPLIESNPRIIKLDQNMFNRVRARFGEA